MLFRACAYCDHPNPVGTNFCNDCGAALHLQPCRQCGAVSVVKARHCPSCKSPFPERPLIDVSIPWAGEPPGQPGHFAGATRSNPLPGIPRPPGSRSPVLPPAERGRAAEGNRPPASERSTARPASSSPAPAATPATRPQAEAAAFTRRLLEKASQSSLLGTASDASGPRDELVIPPPSSRPRPTRPTHPSTPAPEPEAGSDAVPASLGSDRPNGLLSAPQYSAETQPAARPRGNGGGDPPGNRGSRSGVLALTLAAFLVGGGVVWWVLDQDLLPQLGLPGLTTPPSPPGAGAPALGEDATRPAGLTGPAALSIPSPSSSALPTSTSSPTPANVAPLSTEASLSGAASGDAATRPEVTGDTPPSPTPSAAKVEGTATGGCLAALRALGLCDDTSTPSKTSRP